MASTQLVRIPESHQADITEMMLAKKASKKNAAAMQSSTVIYTDATMMNRVPSTLTLINHYDYSGHPIGSYPPLIPMIDPLIPINFPLFAMNHLRGFDHEANATVDLTGSVGCVVYSGLNHPSGVGCAWLMAWDHPFNSTSATVKVYVETGLLANYQPGTLDFGKVKQLLDASGNTSYYHDKGTGAAAFAEISFGDTADIGAIFIVAK